MPKSVHTQVFYTKREALILQYKQKGLSFRAIAGKLRKKKDDITETRIMQIYHKLKNACQSKNEKIIKVPERRTRDSATLSPPSKTER